MIHPGQEKFLTAEIKGTEAVPFDAIVEPTPEFIHRTGLVAAVVKIPNGHKTIPVCVTNIWDNPIKV